MCGHGPCPGGAAGTRTPDQACILPSALAGLPTCPGNGPQQLGGQAPQEHGLWAAAQVPGELEHRCPFRSGGSAFSSHGRAGTGGSGPAATPASLLPPQLQPTRRTLLPTQLAPRGSQAPAAGGVALGRTEKFQNVEAGPLPGFTPARIALPGAGTLSAGPRVRPPQRPGPSGLPLTLPRPDLGAAQIDCSAAALRHFRSVPESAPIGSGHSAVPTRSAPWRPRGPRFCIGSGPAGPERRRFPVRGVTVPVLARFLSSAWSLTEAKNYISHNPRGFRALDMAAGGRIPNGPTEVRAQGHGSDVSGGGSEVI